MLQEDSRAAVSWHPICDVSTAIFCAALHSQGCFESESERVGAGDGCRSETLESQDKIELSPIKSVIRFNHYVIQYLTISSKLSREKEMK